METGSFVIERVYSASLERVWQAITDLDKMKEWYFNIAEFKPEVGFEFTFNGGSEERTYVHLCKVTEVIANKKISYTWRYKDYEGNSEVSFELFDEAGKTRLRLTHTGLESFPQNNPDFARESFSKGWTYIIGTSLPKYLEKIVL